MHSGHRTQLLGIVRLAAYPLSHLPSQGLKFFGFRCVVPEEGVRSPVTGLAEGCEPPHEL